MKVKSIVKATKEFERLQGLIDHIDECLAEFAKVGQSVPDDKEGALYVSGGYITFNVEWGGESKKKTESIDIKVKSGVANLIREDVVILLETKRVELLKQQEALEI